jgi:hypothetical protein
MKRLKALAPAFVFLMALAFLLVVLPIASAGAQDTTKSFITTADAYVSKANSNTNYGGSKTLYLDNSPIKHAYLRFTVSGLNGSSVSSAKLRVYANSGSGSGLEVHALSDNQWKESTITYNNAPAMGNTLTKTGGFSGGRWLELDVTPSVRGEGAFNFVLSTPGETNISLAARESGEHAPQLVVSLPATAPTPTVNRTATTTFTRTPTLPANPTATPIGSATPSGSASYVLFGWNDLGMHCYNRDFQDLAVLPPFNTLWAQVIQRGNPPRIVTQGIRVEYRFPDNTYSVGKSNFWTYAQKLFGLAAPLQANVGLKGKGLSGQMDVTNDHFVAEGIPLTEFSDSAPTTPNPWQKAELVAKDAATGAQLANLTVVAPVSTEMHCDTCHKDGGVEGIRTGKVETNILTLHDKESQGEYPAGHTGALMNRKPVLCAECHSSNALGEPGVSGVPSLSKAMHSKHDGIVPNTLDGCYNCHPGPSTKCLRDVMSAKGMDCISCHGTLSKVKENPNPWLNEPRCDTCHGSAYHQDQALYRNSKGHGGVYCEACHDSPHAIAPSTQPADAIKFNQLQGHGGPIDTCTVCHLTKPTSGGPH